MNTCDSDQDLSPSYTEALADHATLRLGIGGWEAGGAIYHLPVKLPVIYTVFLFSSRSGRKLRFNLPCMSTCRCKVLTCTSPLTETSPLWPSPIPVSAEYASRIVVLDIDLHPLLTVANRSPPTEIIEPEGVLECWKFGAPQETSRSVFPLFSPISVD